MGRKSLGLDFKTCEELYDSGQTLTQIAKQFNCSAATVSNLFKKNNKSRRPQGRPLRKNSSVLPPAEEDSYSVPVESTVEMSFE